MPVDPIDLDADMVALASVRLASRGDRVRLWTGDASSIDAPDATYDAVFDFGIIHHIPLWRDALVEIARVLLIVTRSATASAAPGCRSSPSGI